LFEAEDEAQEWPELHAAIRNARTHYQAGEQMPDWQGLEELLRQVQARIAPPGLANRLVLASF